jgi:hypothetical protein
MRALKCKPDVWSPCLKVQVGFKVGVRAKERTPSLISVLSFSVFTASLVFGVYVWLISVNIDG